MHRGRRRGTPEARAAKGEHQAVEHAGNEDALREQDSFLKCGIALDPDTMLPKLRQRLDQGFAVRMPKKLFRPFLLPASVRTSVEREGRRLELAVLPGELRFVDGGLWYASRVDVKMEKAAGK